MADLNPTGILYDDVQRLEASTAALPALIRAKADGFENDLLFRMVHKKADGVSTLHWTPDEFSTELHYSSASVGAIPKAADTTGNLTNSLMYETGEEIVVSELTGSPVFLIQTTQNTDTDGLSTIQCGQQGLSRNNWLQMNSYNPGATGNFQNTGIVNTSLSALWTNGDNLIIGTYSDAPIHFVQGIVTGGIYWNTYNTMTMVSGNVGIGTTNPFDKLVINGGGICLQGGVGGVDQIYSYGGETLSLTSNGQGMCVVPGGNVGIGTTDPHSLLDVNGEARFGTYSSVNVGRTVIKTVSSAAVLSMYNPGAYEVIHIDTNGNSFMQFGGGNLYIGAPLTTAPSRLTIGSGDIECDTAANGLILTDRVCTTNRYRLKIESGTLSIELV
jgi:hypothetical protein